MNQQTPAPAKSSSLKWLIIIVVIIIILGGGYLLWAKYGKTSTSPASTSPSALVTPSVSPSSEVAGWQTYISTKFGYSFKYPTGWFVYDKGLYSSTTKTYRDAGRIAIVDDSQIANIPDESEFALIGFSVNAQEPQLNLTEVRSDTYSDHFDVKIDGQDAIKSVSNKPSELGEIFSTIYYINYQSKTYIIQWKNEDANGKHDKIYDTILSTFQFTQ
jgi:hypothetical protein